MKLLGISGSLRAASLNSALLRTAQSMALDGIEIQLCDVVGELPLFNPDRQDHPPPAVLRLHGQVATADALLIASPEYAHGMTGAIKNLLDWLVSFEPFVHKPVAVFNTSPRAHHADAALREALATMSATHVAPTSFNIPLLGSGLDEVAMAQSPMVRQTVQDALTALQAVIGAQRAHTPAFPLSGPPGPQA